MLSEGSREQLVRAFEEEGAADEDVIRLTQRKTLLRKLLDDLRNNRGTLGGGWGN